MVNTARPRPPDMAGRLQSRSGAELRLSVRPSNASVETLSTTSSSECPSHVRQRPTAGHLAGSARLEVAAHPFGDSFRLTGCRVGPRYVSSQMIMLPGVLQCVLSSAMMLVTRRHPPRDHRRRHRLLLPSSAREAPHHPALFRQPVCSQSGVAPCSCPWEPERRGGSIPFDGAPAGSQ